jgi:hypothetical protein
MLYDKAHLRDKNVAFKLKGSGVYFGVVKYVEDDGFWISAPDLILELQNDKAWGAPPRKDGDADANSLRSDGEPGLFDRFRGVRSFSSPITDLSSKPKSSSIGGTFRPLAPIID